MVLPSVHRTLRFPDVRAVIAELDRLDAARRAGTLRVAGNWTPGQIFGHVATWIDYGFDGYPFRPPWLLRVIGLMLKKRMISKSMPRAIKIPGAPGGTYGADVPSFDAGLTRLRAAWARLAAAAPQARNPILGRLTHAQWFQLHLRHAELHLGYLHTSEI